MKRRNFIVLSMYTGAAFVIPYTGCNADSGITRKPWMQPAVLSHICDAKTLKEIGAAYREKFAGESNKKQLTELLLTDSSHKIVPVNSDDAFINSLLEQKIKKDFETGKTVIVKGWILSETEARQCALFFLTQN
jgi:hypothetical protein